MAEPTRWRIELGDSGEVPPLPGGDEGVLRISCGDSLVFLLPAGSLPTLVDTPALIARDELSEEHAVAVAADGATRDLIAEWQPAVPGPYEVFVRYARAGGEDAPEAGGRQGCDGPACRIVVDPTLRINGEPLPARSVVQLTVLSRCAGPIERWPEALAPQALLGYNMAHFTPIQPPGESGSCYSLDDQNSVDATLMEAPAASEAERLEAVRSSVSRLERDHGMLSAMDIVLNHTAGTAPWLLEHPESAYSLGNSPHLTAAAELDEKLEWYSDEMRDGRLGGPNISSREDVSRVVDGIRRHVLQPLRLHEYFELDEAACLQSFAAEASRFEREDYKAFKDSALPSIGARRRGATVPGEAAARFCRDERTLRDWLRRLQAELYEEHRSVERDILESLRGGVTYDCLELKQGPLGPQHPRLFPCYFRRLRLSPGARQRLGRDTEVVAHNGWVMDWPATEDFAAPAWRFVYLRRHLCSWGDCVKLRYGAGPGDAPFLWGHMARYAVSMAEAFHAIRLDNAHSTPLHVSQHILAQVRKANPHCWIFAELFTGNFHTDLLYQRTLGINALIREAMQCDNPADVSNKLAGSLWGAHPIGAVSLVPTLDRSLLRDRPLTRAANLSCALLPSVAMPLRPRSCPALLFDCTHDNQTPKEKRHPRDALPNAALVAASCASVGSVRGYDELFAANPSVVSERRLYRQISGVEPLQLAWPGVEQPAPESCAEPRPLELVWPHGGAGAVVARGSWDGWQADLPLAKQPDGRWSAVVPAAPLPLYYKFIVDGQWTCDQHQPTASDGSGNVNNVLHAGTAMGCGPPEGPQRIAGPDALLNKLPGILVVKQVLNHLHARLGREGFVEIGVQHLADDIVAVQRRAPDSGRRTVFVVRSAFWRDSLPDGLPCGTAALELPGAIAQLHVAATLFVRDGQEDRAQDGTLAGMECYLRMYGAISEVACVQRTEGGTRLELTSFPPGSILVFSTDPAPEMRLRAEVEQLLTHEAVRAPMDGLTLGELSYLLFSCEAEELDRSGGKRGAYDVPGHGPLVYCGLMGVCAAFDRLRGSSNDLLGSPVAENVRQGDWLLGYLAARLEDMPGLRRVQELLERAKALMARLPRQLAPFHFDLVVSTLCAAAADALLSGSGGFVTQHGEDGQLIRDLALATAQFWGATPNAPLHWDRAKVEGWRSLPSLCAGLPHFSSGFMRNWGRDTFISLRGCLLVTQRFAEARDTLLVYASVVRHGLCPNLLDAANRPRYNARDATWFFLQAIQDYVEMAPEGTGFLKTPVALKWPVLEWDSSLAHLEPSTVGDLIHLILAAHAKGIAFREWNAGPGIDEHMTDEGFNIRIGVNEASGIVYGGNAWNCGTWMDKMGSSATAGNKGSPATPRDGAPVEIVGLLKSTLRWVSGLDRSVFPHDSVKMASGASVTYGEWDALLQRSFEQVFWIDPDERSDAPRRGIYRDTDGATRAWQDVQLRPNFCIAMAVAPELFTPSRARLALGAAAERLVGPLGMCTLDPSDPEYRGDYHNDDDSGDKAVAHGWNYHQGPEWVWPLGFFLRAWHRFGADAGSARGARRAVRWLREHRAMLQEGAWRSLPELTNSAGKTCHHSCPAQAWSLATLLDALHAMEGAAAPPARA